MPSIPVGGPERTFDSRVEEIVRRTIRQEAARLVGPQSAEADAQNAGGGLGIQNIRRGVARAVLTDPTTNITVSATSYAALSTPLGLSMVLSGRPLWVGLSVLTAAGASGYVQYDVRLRGASISSDRMIFTYSNQAVTLFSNEIVMEPDSGPADLSVVAMRATADATLFVGGDASAVLTAVEL